MLRREWLIAAREFSVTIRRPSYLLTVLGGPILFGGLIIGGGFLAVKSSVKNEAVAVAVVDSSGVLDPAAIREMEEGSATGIGLLDEVLSRQVGERLAGVPVSVRAAAIDSFLHLRGAALFLMADADSAREAARRGDLDGALIISEDYLETGRVWGYGRSQSFLNDDGPGAAERALRSALLASLLRSEGVSGAVSRRISAPMDLKEFELKEQGARAGQFEEKSTSSEIRSFALPYGFSLLLLMSIFMSSGFLLQGVAEEKENRVIELLLSSVTPNELMLGKVLGLGGAGLLQMMIWLGMGFAALTVSSARWMPDFVMPNLLFVQALVYFLLGYLMIASLMAGAGSLGNTQKESQQLAMWFTMPVIVPMMLMVAILSEPNGTLARVFSYIPLTTPVTMMMRLPSERVPWWEFPATVGLLVVATWFAILLGAKLFRLGSLMYGKRPTLPEIFRWLRQT